VLGPVPNPQVGSGDVGRGGGGRRGGGAGDEDCRARGWGVGLRQLRQCGVVWGRATDGTLRQVLGLCSALEGVKQAVLSVVRVEGTRCHMYLSTLGVWFGLQNGTFIYWLQATV